MTRNFWEYALMTLLALTAVVLVVSMSVLAYRDHQARQEPAPQITVPATIVERGNAND